MTTLRTDNREILADCLWRGFVVGAVMEATAHLVAWVTDRRVLLAGATLLFVWGALAAVNFGFRRNRDDGRRGAALAALFLAALFSLLWLALLAALRPDILGLAAFAGGCMPPLLLWAASHERAAAEAKAKVARFADVGLAPDVRLASPRPASEALARIEEEADKPPSLLSIILTLNASYWHGRSRVCGRVKGNGFELRARNGPAFSLVARGLVVDVHDGLADRRDRTLIEVKFSPPPLLLRPGSWGRRERDRAVILAFLEETLEALVLERPTRGR